MEEQKATGHEYNRIKRKYLEYRKLMIMISGNSKHCVSFQKFYMDRYFNDRYENRRVFATMTHR